MHQSHPARESISVRCSVSPRAVAVIALVFAFGCHDDDALRADGLAGGSGMSGAAAGHAGADAGTSGRGASAGEAAIAGYVGADEVAGGAGSAEVAGNAGSMDSAGSGGSAGLAGSDGGAGRAGSGAGGATSNCAAGGALFVVGNYADAAGNEIILRSGAKAATIALVPAGAATPSKPPQLFLVDRVCKPGGALIANDGSSRYRLDLEQSGSQLAVCWSAAVTTLDAALALPPADASLYASSGCSGQPFTIYTAAAL